MKKKPTPPRWADRFLEWYCRPDLLEDLQGDLREYFGRNLTAHGERRARLIYIIDVIKFFRGYTVRSPKYTYPMNHLTIIQNYFKTSFRNLAKNKLFSVINIIGLAISMSVGLLLITFVTELKNFDTFHANYDRIYRVNNTYHAPGEEPDYYASTSILAGRKIETTLSGVEDLVIINRAFQRDLVVGEKTLAIKGLWASDGFFRVFSFDLLSGNAESALNAPYTLVLTETSALKLFGRISVIGEVVSIEDENYTITGVMKDPPTNSHIQFEMLGSLITQENKMQAAQNSQWLNWSFMWSNYVYLLLPEGANVESVQEGLTQIALKENTQLGKTKINLSLQPLSEVVISKPLSNQLGFNFGTLFIWILSGLAFVVILSACFNYTNLSIARALRRSKEVGIRKVVGASRSQVFLQFVTESILIALLSLLFSYLVFLLIRPGFLTIEPKFLSRIFLRPTAGDFFYFTLLAMMIGLLAGFFPALFFSRIDPVKVIKDVSKLRLFKHINVRKGLITFQYILSICFIVAVSIGYKQYKYSLNFDLGFDTENILNIDLQGNAPDILKQELDQLPDVTDISASMMVLSVGDTYSSTIKYEDPLDSTHIFHNSIDENYLSLHDHELIAGENFRALSTEEKEESEVIVNEKTLERFKLGTPADAIGKELTISGKRMQIIGVVKDFHHSTLYNEIRYFAFRNDPSVHRVLNLKIASADIGVTMNRLQAVWKKIDPVHPFKARFYDEDIQEAYSETTGMIKIIGFLALLAISIASFGLLGMVVFTTETRVKEISIRKVLGATERGLFFMLSRGFISLLIIASLIAIPITYYLFDQLVFAEIVYRAPVGPLELLLSAGIVIVIALLAISSQTIRVARANPAETLGVE